MSARAACAVRHAGGFERRHRPGLGLALGGLLLTGLASAQTAVERHVVAGGGSSSGGAYAITGGYWYRQPASDPSASCNGDTDCLFRNGFETPP